jgi:hypothetical protein
MRLLDLRSGAACVLMLVSASGVPGCERRGEAPHKPQAALQSAVQAAQTHCAGKAKLAVCLIEQANQTRPANMQICAAAAEAIPCKEDPNTFALCPAPATDGNGACKVVFD